MASTTSKYETVRDHLAKAILSKQMQSGQRLPSERKLADEFKVSYLTVRRAVGDLVEAELLERRARQGTFVSSRLDEQLATKGVNIICTSHESLTARTFIACSITQAEKRKWQSHIIELAHGSEKAAVRMILGRDPSVVFVAGPELKGRVGEAIQQAAERVVIVGNRLDGLGVPSIMMDDTQAVRLAISRLRKDGHKKIGVITGPSNHLVSRIVKSVWKNECSVDSTPEELVHRVISVTNTPYESYAKMGYEAFRRYYKENHCDATAFFCQVDEMAPGVLAAMREVGLAIPEDISMITMANTCASAYAYPPLTSIDSNLDSHVQRAFETIDAALKGPLDPADLFKLVQPRLIERQSVASVKK